MDGIFNINKPSGVTSFSIISLVRRLTGKRRVGHAGTLDPLASGVLPVCFGRGTRVIEFIMDASKVYKASIRLGVTTDTYDTEGKVIAENDCSSVTRQDVESALGSFRGQILQKPPMYSALKHNGQCLYKLARAGITIEREMRPANIYRLELLNFTSPMITIEMECSKGTYVRSVANDLGEMLGCGACMTDLVRLKYGPFDIQGSVTVKELEKAFSNGDWQRLMYPIDTVVRHWESVVLDDEQERNIRNGVPVLIDNNFVVDKNRCCAYSANGLFLAILCFDGESGYWQPQKVFA